MDLRKLQRGAEGEVLKPRASRGYAAWIGFLAVALANEIHRVYVGPNRGLSHSKPVQRSLAVRRATCSG